jgi:hypothetical protein
MYMEDVYMVTNEVWAEAGMTPRRGKDDLKGGEGNLHLHCLEARLGRKVNKDTGLLFWCVGKAEEELFLWCMEDEGESYQMMATAKYMEGPEYRDWL